MVHETINALNNNKLHEVVIRMSQMSVKQLEKLLKTFLMNDYVLMYRGGKKKDSVIYNYELPDAYNLSFSLCENEGHYFMALEFYSTRSFFDPDLEQLVDSEYYELKLTKSALVWKNITDNKEKKFIIQLLKRAI